MCSDNGAHAVRSMIVALEEGCGGIKERIDAVEQLAMRDLAAEVTPEHLDRVEPGAVGRQVQQDEPTSGATQHRLDLVVFMGLGIVPGDVDRLMSMLGEQRRQELGDLTPPLVRPGHDHGLTRVPVDGAQPIAPRRLHGCGDHHPLAFGAPQRPQGRVPADVELISVVEDHARAGHAHLRPPFFLGRQSWLCLDPSGSGTRR